MWLLGCVLDLLTASKSHEMLQKTPDIRILVFNIKRIELDEQLRLHKCESL